MEVRCPRCGLDFVRRARPEGLVEIVASAVSLHPFTCQLCARRFRAFQWGGRSSVPSADHRHYERISVNLPMTFSTDAGGGKGMALDVSIGGCAFKTDPAPRPDTILAVQLQVPDLEHPLDMEAAVVRSVRSMYVGVEFLRLNPKQQHRLTQFVAGMLTARRLKEDAALPTRRPREADPVP